LRFPKGDSREAWNDSFGPRVVGTPYVAHQETKSNISVVDQHKKHPILNGVSRLSWESPAKLYLTRLEPVPLLLGDGQGRPKTMEKRFGTIHVSETETDIVAWTWANEWGGKVFSTTLGHAGDFGDESFMRILVNGICWSTDTEILPAETKIQTFDIEMEVPSKYKARK
jgi:type 1 glutamine amidotransferase